MLNDMQLDAIHFKGPGTDLRVGLLPEVALAGLRIADRDRPSLRREHADGKRSSPHRTCGARRDLFARRARSRSTGASSRVSRFASRPDAIVEVKPTRAATSSRASSTQTTRRRISVRSRSSTAPSRIGQTGLTFFDTLFDENTTCHVAYGGAYAESGRGRLDRRRQRLERPHRLHGRRGPKWTVDAVTRSGAVVPLLRDDVWQLDE